MNFSHLLKELRAESKMTAKELSSKIGYSTNLIYDWEKGRAEPNCETLIKLAGIFDVSVDYLLGRTDDFGNLTPEEYSAGIRTSTKKSISAIEDEMLMLFRQVGKKFGADGQRSVVAVIENMLNLK